MVTSGKWLIDSGATNHMTGNPQCFSLLESHERLPPVYIADGSPSPVLGTGDVRLTPSLSLENTLYVPKFPCNLLSVNSICKKLKCSVTFTPTSCSFQDPSSKQTIATGTESGGLYFLDSTTSQALTSSSTDLLKWHLRLGHPPARILHQLFPPLRLQSSPLNCEACQIGKHHRSSFPAKQSRGSSRPFDLIHSDIWGPAPTPSIGRGSLYFVTFIDDFSRCTWVYLLRDRSELFSIWECFYNMIQTQFAVSVKILRSDNAKEYLSTAFSNFCARTGLVHQTSCVYTSQQNGVAERKNRHLLDVARTLLQHMHVPRSYWGYAVLLSCYLINRIPSTILHGDTPFSIIYPAQDAFALPLRIFGCTAFVHSPSATRDKLSPRATKCIFLGYSTTQKGYCCFDPILRKQFVSADVTFFEDTPYFSKATSTTDPSTITSPSSDIFQPHPTPPPSLLLPSSTPIHLHAPTPAPPSPPPSSPSHISPPTSILPALSDLGPALSATDALDLEDKTGDDRPIALRKGVRSCTMHPLSHVVSYNGLSLSSRHFALAISATDTPRSYHDALTIPHWKAAMDEEMATLTERGTWTLVPAPPGVDVVGCRWVFVIKFHPDGTVDRYKARLVAKGYTQTYGIDYFDTFSPVARLSTIRVLFSVAVNRGWSMCQLDIKNAFLYGDLHEDVYMEQPPGYVAPGETRVCKLKMALYGLKQSPRNWFDKFSSVVSIIGFARSSTDHSLFIRKTTQGLVVLAVYVDDILLTGNDKMGIEFTKKHLRHHFVIKDMGSPKYFLGIEISRKQTSVVLSQRKYALDLLKETGLTGAKPARCPMTTGEDKTWLDDSPLLADVTKYRRLVGKLIYLTVTRPDIAYAVGKVSQFMQTPRECHFQSALKILEYVKGAPGKGLLFQKNDHLKIKAYSDASYADDKGDRKSTSGFCTFVGGNLVSWKSKKQSVVSRSSAEAEYRSMASTTCELKWLRALMHDLGEEYHYPLLMYCDNKAAIYISKNPVFHERTKHIEVDCHFIREEVQKGQICTPFVTSENELADCFTKPISTSFSDICNKLGMIDIYAPACGGVLEPQRQNGRSQPELERSQQELERSRLETDQRSQPELERSQQELERSRLETDQRSQPELERSQPELERSQPELERSQAELERSRLETDQRSQPCSSNKNPSSPRSRTSSRCQSQRTQSYSQS